MDLLMELPPGLLWHSFLYLSVEQVLQLRLVNKAISRGIDSPQGDAAIWAPKCSLSFDCSFNHDLVRFAPDSVFCDLLAWGCVKTYKELFDAGRTTRGILGFWRWGVASHRGAMLMVDIVREPVPAAPAAAAAGDDSSGNDEGGGGGGGGVVTGCGGDDAITAGGDGDGDKPRYVLQGRMLRPAPAGIGQTVLRLEDSVVFSQPLASLEVGRWEVPRHSLSRSHLRARLGDQTQQRGVKATLAGPGPLAFQDVFIFRTATAPITGTIATTAGSIAGSGSAAVAAAAGVAPPHGGAAGAFSNGGTGGGFHGVGFSMPGGAAADNGASDVAANAVADSELVFAPILDVLYSGVVTCPALPTPISVKATARLQRRWSLTLSGVLSVYGGTGSGSSGSGGNEGRFPSSMEVLRRRVPGLYYGIYGPHGCEVIAVRWSANGRRLEGIKVTGDFNVPAGKLTFESCGSAMHAPSEADVTCNCLFDCECIPGAGREAVTVIGAMPARTKTAGLNYNNPTWNQGRLLFLCARSEREYVRRRLAAAGRLPELPPAADNDPLHPPIVRAGVPAGPSHSAHRSISILLVFDAPDFKKSTVLRPFDA